jgi:hypothetical protein
MAEHVSPEFHAEIIIPLFNDYKDLRRSRNEQGFCFRGHRQRT